MKNGSVSMGWLCLPPFAAFAVGAGISFIQSAIMMGAGVHNVGDIWFEADTSRVYYNLIRYGSDHHRTSVHPLITLFLSTPALFLRTVGLGPDLAVRVMMAMGAGLLASSFFILCRVITTRNLDAAIYAALLCASASFLFFAGVTELYLWGSWTILLAILSTCVPEPYKPMALIAGSIASFSITVTNWMAGLAATLLAAGWKDAAKYSIVAFAIAAALAAVQSNVYPRTGPFLKVLGESQYATIDIVPRITNAPKSFLLDPIVLSGVRAPHANDRTPKAIHPEESLNLAIDSRTLAMVLWTSLLVMLAACSISNWSREFKSNIAILIAIILAGQVILHIFYGEIVFLYSAHFVPLLIAGVAFTSRTLWRIPALAVASLLVPVAAVSNLSTLREAVRLLVALMPPA